MLLRHTVTLGAIALLLLSGCSDRTPSDEDFVSKSLQEVARHPATVSTIASTSTATTRASGSTAHATAASASHRSATTMPPTGIEISNERIVIDTRQARQFLEKLTQKFDNNLKRIEHDLKQNRLKTQNPTGIIVTEDRIEVDLNQTERFMEQWVNSMEKIGRELDSVFKQLDQSLQ